jgi:hypothetical protein
MARKLIDYTLSSRLAHCHARVEYIVAIPTKVVLSHPFSGSLYAFFDKACGGNLAKDRKLPQHSYYRMLFGVNYGKLTEISLTLTLLFPEILIAPADNHMPDSRRYGSSGEYKNPELGLQTSWTDLETVKPEIEEAVSKDLENPKIQKILFTLPVWAKRSVLNDTRYDIYQAMIHDCPIISAGGRRKLIELITHADYSTRLLVGAVKVGHLEGVESYLKLIGTLFDPVTIDALYDLKNDRQLRRYAKGLLNAMLSHSDPATARRAMAELVLNALEEEKITHFIKGGFDAAAAIIGLGPGLKSKLGSKALSGGGKLVGKYRQTQSWYEFGPHIKRKLSLHQLRTAAQQILAEPKKQATTLIID